MPIAELYPVSDVRNIHNPVIQQYLWNTTRQAMYSFFSDIKFVYHPYSK